MKVYDMVIIGGGPAGYTAAMYAARAGLSVIVLEKLSAGGQMALTTQIDNYPGFEEGIDGFELAEKMQLQAQRFGAETELAEVTNLDLSGEVKKIATSEGAFYGRTLVIATGANPRKLGAEGEDTFTNRGVHYCAACDGMAYRGKTVVVIGGGNSAVADALTLSRIARKVILVHRRNNLRATKVYHDPLMAAENVEIRWNSEITRIIGDKKAEGVQLKDTLTGSLDTIQCDGIFISVGRSPATGLFAEKVDMDKNGYIIADESTCTNVPGVFAIGDVRTKALRQIVTAVADGATAVHYAEEYLMQ